MRRRLPFLIRSLSLASVALLTGAIPLVAYNWSALEAYAQSSCWPDVVPVGQSTLLLKNEPPQPVWCVALGPEPVTRVAGDNSWLDDFKTNINMGTFEDGEGEYRIFHNAGASTYQDRYFRNQNHWMIDIAGFGPEGFGNCSGRGTGSNPNPGGCYNHGNTVIRPNRSFTFQPDGHFVVEADVAAGQVDYSGNAWPEIVISMADHPTSIVDGLYAYGDFGGFWTIGCRLQPSRVPICAVFDDTGRPVADGGRVYETSYWQHADAQTWGGEPGTPERDAAWRVCLHDEPDPICRDRFRLDLTKDSLTLYVNAVKYFEVTGLPPKNQLPDAFLKGPLYVYNASTIYQPYVDSIGHFPATRFHWNHFAVNPGPEMTISPLYCADQPRAICPPFQPKPEQPTSPPLTPFQGSAQPAASAPQQPSAPSAPSAGGINFGDLSNPGRALTGQYPTGTIDWGNDGWYLSGPYDKFTGKSISFTEGPTSATFSFIAPKQLVQLDVDNGGNGGTTITLSCDGQNTQSVDLGPHQTTTIKTGWSSTCSQVTVTSTNGWFTNFTNLVIN